MHVHKTVPNRWFVVIGAILIQLCLGAIYAWSVFTPDLVEAGWTKAQTQTVFSVGLFFFAVVMIQAGRLLPVIGPKKVSIAGGLVLGLGYILAGIFGKTSFPAILIFIGIIGGSGIGLSYVVPIAVGMRWFPDKKGLITGFAVAGFGFGAMLWVKLAGNWGNVLELYGISNTFIVYGVLFIALVLMGSIWMSFPPVDWKPAGWIPPTKNINSPDTSAPAKDYNSLEMIKTTRFHLISITFAFSASAGLMTIGLMKLFPMQALLAAGYENASGISGTAMAIFFSIANGVGRIAWGAISDYTGRRLALQIMLLTQGIIVLLFQFMAGIPALLYLGATLIGFNFGGNFALFPTLTADVFGARYVGQNYGWVFLAYGFGGIFGPVMGGILGDLGNFPLAFTICGTLCLFAAGIIYFMKVSVVPVPEPSN